MPRDINHRSPHGGHRTSFRSVRPNPVNRSESFHLTLTSCISKRRSLMLSCVLFMNSHHPLPRPYFLTFPLKPHVCLLTPNSKLHKYLSLIFPFWELCYPCSCCAAACSASLLNLGLWWTGVPGDLYMGGLDHAYTVALSPSSSIMVPMLCSLLLEFKFPELGIQHLVLSY